MKLRLGTNTLTNIRPRESPRILRVLPRSERVRDMVEIKCGIFGHWLMKEYLWIFRWDLDRVSTWDRVHLALGSSAGSANDTWVSARISIFTILRHFLLTHFIYSNSCCLVLSLVCVRVRKMESVFCDLRRVSSLLPLRTDWSLNWSPLSIYTADTGLLLINNCKKRRRNLRTSGCCSSKRVCEAQIHWSAPLDDSWGLRTPWLYWIHYTCPGR